MWLTISAEARPVRSVHLGGGSYVLGREAGCGLVIDDRHVSQRHARLDVEGTGAWLTDLGSTNGTYFDRHRIERPVWVIVPAEFRVGRTTVRLSAEEPTVMLDAPAGDPAPSMTPGPPSPTPPIPPPPRLQHDPTGTPHSAPSYDVQDAGPVAGRDVRMGGRQVAGRDMIIQEGFKLQTRMRASAKNAIRIGCLSFLAGLGLFGYFVMTWNSEIFDAVTEPSAEPPNDLPSPLPWLPLGAVLMFAGLVLIAVGLLIPRDRVVTRADRGDR
jgi:Inner membrane component of T3SS, cytoplasmic domain